MENIPSPCIKVCCLNDKDICIGCKRSLDEILQWGSATRAKRMDILENCAQRAQQKNPTLIKN